MEYIKKRKNKNEEISLLRKANREITAKYNDTALLVHKKTRCIDIMWSVVVLILLGRIFL